MRPFTSTISLDEARQLLNATVRPITRTDRIAIADAAGRVVAATVMSPIDVPAFDRALMDGYAVIAADTAAATPASPAQLRLIDRVYTGQVGSVAVVPGTCAEIATGAPPPDGSDAVVMVEDTAANADHILIRAAAAPGRNIGRRASDIRAGDEVVREGEVLRPSSVGALAAIGQPHVQVYAKPRVAILSTGNEVVDPGTPLAAGQVYDVNRFTLGAIVDAHGGISQPHKVAQDTLGALERALDACMEADLIVFSGGSSVGTRDLVTDLIAARGEMIFHGVAVKPGKPTALARIGATPFFGMPGNPTSCLSNGYVLLLPFLRATARLPPYAPRLVRAPLGRRIASVAGRHQFHTVRLREGIAYPAFKGSGEITSLSQADGYIEIPAHRSEVGEGEEVEVTLF
ncbi:MAG TPA: gephyrin-like molybdotransferase Glp [Vicinamibacterales bacterium]|nr:gephyrin-like molybdotransferase Glp [Vicinamibacterales bacterium]